MGLNPDGEKSSDEIIIEAKDTIPLKHALLSRALWCLGIGSACLWFSIQGLNSQISIFFEQEAGFTAQQSVFLFSVLFWFSFIGKFGFGALSDKLPKRTVLLLSSIVLFLGSLLLFDFSSSELTLTKNTTQLSLFTICFGLGFGGSFSMIQLVAVETFGKEYLGRILGIITLIDGLGAAYGTKLLSELAVDSGSYLLPFGVVSAVTFFAIINVFFIRPLEASKS